jgi:hypothetical protein
VALIANNDDHGKRDLVNQFLRQFDEPFAVTHRGVLPTLVDDLMPVADLIAPTEFFEITIVGLKEIWMPPRGFSFEVPASAVKVNMHKILSVDLSCLQRKWTDELRK